MVSLFPRARTGAQACGPVGIKWGQWASTRYDIFEDDMCIALGELVNHAPEHDFEHTCKAVLSGKLS